MIFALALHWFATSAPVPSCDLISDLPPCLDLNIYSSSTLGSQFWHIPCFDHSTYSGLILGCPIAGPACSGIQLSTVPVSGPASLQVVPWWCCAVVLHVRQGADSSGGGCQCSHLPAVVMYVLVFVSPNFWSFAEVEGPTPPPPSRAWRESPFLQGCWAVRGKRARPVRIDCMVLWAKEGAAGLLSGLFTSPRTPGTHWALPCLGHLWAASGPLITAAKLLSQTMASAPLFLLFCSRHSLMLLHLKGHCYHMSVPTVLAWVPEGDPVLSPGAPCLLQPASTVQAHCLPKGWWPLASSHADSH